MKTQILNGDCIEMMKTLPDRSVNCCVTSPPYFGLRDYGTASWEGGDPNCDHKIPSNEHDPKRGTSDASTSHTLRFNRAHCHKCGATRVDKQLGLEETPEAFVQKMVEVFSEVKRVLRDDGTLWLNLGDSYVSKPTGSLGNFTGSQHGFGGGHSHQKASLQRPDKSGFGIPEKNLIGIPWRVAFALQADGWYLRQDIIWHKPNPMPESVQDRCTKAHEYIFLLSKSPKYYFNNEAIKEQAISGNKDIRNKRTVWSVNTKPYAGAHFATFPPELIRPCILAGCPKGGVVLDPFGGSGTTAAVAMEEGRSAILCELNPEYIPLINDRLSKVQPSLF
jgi:site-specific DNA-methyltransferase (adenine-specific)